MERFALRENVLLGYNFHKSFYISAGSSLHRNSFDDFNDVFGGPPRRFSIHETRFSLSEAVDPGNDQWSELGQKPVFGEENLNRRRYQSDFFDDIFRVDESCSSPRVPFGSNPGSRVLSPARPLPPKAEPFGTSLPANFSLPSKLIKAVDFPLFASSNYSPYRMNDSIANGMSPQCTKNAFLSRFSSGVLEHDELKDDIRLSKCQSPLPKELPLNIDESQNTSKFKETDMGSGLKEAPKVVEAQSNTTRFHFSIYKWAGRGMPLLTPLRGGSISKLKEKSKPERCSTSNGRIESADVARKLLKPNQPERVDSTFLNHSISKKTRSLTLEGKTNGKENTKDSVEPQQVVDEADLDMLESKSLESIEFTVESVPVSAITSEKREDKKQSSLREEEREILTNKQETHKLELEPLRSLLNDEIEGQDCTGNIKNSIIQEASKASPQGPHTDSGDNLISYKVKGKVKEFVKLFNQEDSLDQQINADTQSRSSRLKSTIVYEANKGPRITTIRMSQKKPLPSMNKMPDFSGMVDESIEKLKSVHQNSQMKTSICKTSNSSIVQKDSEPIHDSLPNSPNVMLGGIDGNLQGNIVIEELSHEQEKKLQAGEDFEDFQVADIKIRHWSNGKKGNIRSLLSTLQFVLWPESGWKPVPLVDIIEGTAVKRAYQKALLCLHPDKLQQKGAASYKKHIAEKVFDILQEAWDHFNSLGSL